MHVTNWAEAQQEDPEIEAAMDWCWLDRQKSKPWAQQLLKFKSHLSPNKDTPTGKKPVEKYRLADLVWRTVVPQIYTEIPSGQSETLRSAEGTQKDCH